MKRCVIETALFLAHAVDPNDIIDPESYKNSIFEERENDTQTD
jgi:hypothetical protein